MSVRVSKRTLEEIYFPRFEAALKRGRAASVIYSYNCIDGVYSCQHPATLRSLRAAGLTGFVGPDAIPAVRDLAAANARSPWRVARLSETIDDARASQPRMIIAASPARPNPRTVHMDADSFSYDACKGCEQSLRAAPRARR